MLVRLILVLLLLSLSAGVAAQELDLLRDWMHISLSNELQLEQPNMNMLASYSLPLVTDVQRTGNPISRELVRHLRYRVSSLDAGRMSCGQLADVYLISGFLSRIGEGLNLAAIQGRVTACAKSESLFDLANTLVFFCGHAKLDHNTYLPGGLELLTKAQQADGSFVLEDGSAHYYLTSHALLALYYCEGDSAAIEKTQELLTKLLPEFQKIEFLDGLAESLIFLRWSGSPAPNEPVLTIWLKSKVRADGGVCFRNKPDCEPHWHPVSLMMQLLLEQP